MSLLNELTDSLKDNTTLTLEKLALSGKPKKLTESEKLEQEIISSSEDINYSTKIKTLNEKQELLAQKLKKEKNPQVKEQIKDELNLILREKTRLIQFFAIKNKWTNEQKEILSLSQNQDNLRSSDILFLKKKWADLTKLLLVYKDDATKEISRDKIIENDKFIANFWENKNINAVIWAGDILPNEIKEVEINGTKWIRKNHPRPGFYDISGKYLPIYDGFEIKISKIGNMSEEELLESLKAENDRFEKLRLNDMIDSNSTFTSLEEDKMLLSKVEETKKKREEERQKWSAYNEIKKDKFLEVFGTTLDNCEKQYNIPKEAVLKLIEKESSFNPQAKNLYSSAYWLGQFLTWTWRQVCDFQEFVNIDMDRYNPEHQIMWIFAYLNHLKTLKNCSIADAIVYYHTWPHFSDKHVAWALAVNPAIKKYIEWEPDARSYMQAAAKFYWVENYT